MNQLTNLLNLINPKSIILADEIEFGKKYTKRIMDARSAAFYAFGESKITNENVLLVIDGEYLTNVYTVLTEAWFQKTNLIVLALYDSIYDIETNYLNRCTVANVKFIDKDYPLFEEKVKESLNLIGPKVINVVTKKNKKEKEYSNVIKSLNKLLSVDDKLYVYNAKEEKVKCHLENIPVKYKYGIISKYLSNIEGKTNKNILLCSKECMQVDSNILNNRAMNNNFKIIVLGDISEMRDWILDNNIIYKESSNLKKDLEELVNLDSAAILVIKEDL